MTQGVSSKKPATLIFLVAVANAIILAVAGVWFFTREKPSPPKPPTRVYVPFTRPPVPTAGSGVLPENWKEASWPMFHGRSDFNGHTNVKLPERPTLRWKFPTDGDVNSSPVIGGGRVFVGSDDGFVYALDLASGKQLWAHDTDAAVESSPCLADGSVYVGDTEGHLLCFESSPGGR